MAWCICGYDLSGRRAVERDFEIGVLVDVWIRVQSESDAHIVLSDVHDPGGLDSDLLVLPSRRAILNGKVSGCGS